MGEPSTPIDQLSNQFVAEYARLDPIAATFVGTLGFDDQLPDLSPEGYSAREALIDATLSAAASVETPTAAERRAKAVLIERLSVDRDTVEAGASRCAINVIESPIHNLRGAFDLMATETDEDWSNIDRRLAGWPSALAQYTDTLREEAAKGNVVAIRQYREVAGQIANWTGSTGGPSFFDGLVAPYDGSPALKRDLANHADAASAAAAEFSRFLADEMAPLGHEADGVGRERYQLASRSFLGATIDLDETYAWGWQELARIHDDMVATSQRIVPGGTVADAMAALDADPARSRPTKEAFRDWMQELSDKALSELNGTHFDIPEPVQRLECCIAPTNDGGVYYTGPSADFSRPGRMWWSVPDGVTSFYTWRETTTVYHEGVPGHHLQIGQTAYRSELLNEWQRRWCWVSGHGEGWALYAERLMDELGYLADAGDRLGMLDGQSMRAARVVIDIGLHLGLPIPADNPFGFHPGEKWNAEIALEFLGDHAQMDEGNLRFEINRYLGWPGQAPSYKVGERLWLNARADAEARHGDAFDLRAFHREALDLGSVGLDVLSAELALL